MGNILEEARNLAARGERFLRPTDIELMFEALLANFYAGNDKSEIDLGNVEGTEIKQSAFVQKGNSPDMPRVGLLVKSDDREIEYSASIYVANLDDFGEIAVYSPHFFVIGKGRGVSARPEMFSPLGVFVQDKYDASISQAVANTLRRDVLYSRTAPYDSDLRQRLVREGYEPRPGYPEFLDKVFHPQV